MWDRSFTAMLSEIERISGISKDVLIPEIRQIHQRHGTSEYSHLIEDLPSLRAAFPNQNLKTFSMRLSTPTEKLEKRIESFILA